MFDAAFSLSRKTATQASPGHNDEDEAGPRQARLAASHGDIGLFERGKREAVQLPWSPLAASLATERADTQALSTLGDSRSLRHHLLAITRSSQMLRLAILQHQVSSAQSAFDDLTSTFRIMLGLQGGMPGSPKIPGSHGYKTAEQLWSGSFVRLFSEHLRQRNLSAAQDLIAQSLAAVGSQYVGSQAVKRLLLAACSPAFHPQDFRLPGNRQDRPSILQWPKLDSALSLVRRWAEDVKASHLDGRTPAVDAGLTSKQRFRSVLKRDGYSTATLARAAAVYVVSSACLRHLNTNMDETEISETQALEAFLVMMSSLQCNVNYATWWRTVEKEMITQMEAWEVYIGRSMRQVLPWRDMERICLEYEQARVVAFGRDSEDLPR